MSSNRARFLSGIVTRSSLKPVGRFRQPAGDPQLWTQTRQRHNSSTKKYGGGARTERPPRACCCVLPLTRLILASCLRAPLPAALDDRGAHGVVYRPRRDRAGARLFLP
jgi:hypothetical protein